MRVRPASLDQGHDVGDAHDARIGKETARTNIPGFHRSAEGLQPCQPRTSLAGTRPLRAAPADDIVAEISQFHDDGMRACMRLRMTCEHAR